jgi:hypothetical protein
MIARNAELTAEILDCINRARPSFRVGAQAVAEALALLIAHAHRGASMEADPVLDAIFERLRVAIDDITKEFPIQQRFAEAQDRRLQ